MLPFRCHYVIAAISYVYGQIDADDYSSLMTRLLPLRRLPFSRHLY